MEEYNVAAQVKIYLDDPSQMERVKGDLDKVAKVNKTWEEDVGFGIKVLKVNLLLKDSEGGMDQLEGKIRNIKNVSEVCTIHAATANPVSAIITETSNGRGVVGVIDGATPIGIETEEDRKKRREFIRKIGYKR